MRIRTVLVLIIVVLLVLPLSASGATARGRRGSAAEAPSAAAAGAAGERASGHAKPLPKFVLSWMGAKAAAADLVATGEATVDAKGRVLLDNGQFVDYELEGTDHIVTVLVEFADGVEGPLHNQIAEPDREVDNVTYWVEDFSPAHFEDLMFAPGGGIAGHISTRDYYLELSSGRYTVDGQVSEWLQVPFPESEYGANGEFGDDLNGPVYRLIRDTFEEMDPATAGIDWSQSVVDIWDRYDCDGDGNFDEPDGYVDHFQIVHAGSGEEDGGGAQGEDAIWSHRWYANLEGFGIEGPAGCPFGGYPTGVGDLWVGDYTMEPENGGVGVFAHEFGHDLGLPDLYDYLGDNDNSVSFWSLMSDGANVSDDPFSLGTKPSHMGPWEKLVLGWLGGDLARVEAGTTQTVKLGPAEGATLGAAQALRIDLPDYDRKLELPEPEGSDPFYYYSGQGDGLDNDMTRSLPAPLASNTKLRFRANFDIETDWDYAYVVYSTDGGATWQNAGGNLSTDTDPYGQNFGNGITGRSRGWVNAIYSIPAGATDYGFRYWTDFAVVEPGFAVDSIRLGDGPVDDGSTPKAWTRHGFRKVRNGKLKESVFHYFLVESRSYVRSDTALCGAYSFVTFFWADRQCYADGVLIWYRDSGYGDNNVSQHPGRGQILVVDSHPVPAPAVVGRGLIRERWQTWDSTFGFDRHSVTLRQRKGGEIHSRDYVAKPVSVFYDSGPKAYWTRDNRYASVRTPGSGVKITLVRVFPDGMTYIVKVH